jgi:hypothetical protein
LFRGQLLDLLNHWTQQSLSDLLAPAHEAPKAPKAPKFISTAG